MRIIHTLPVMCVVALNSRPTRAGSLAHPRIRFVAWQTQTPEQTPKVEMLVPELENVPLPDGEPAN
jgi:hypothetical protein